MKSLKLVIAAVLMTASVSAFAQCAAFPYKNNLYAELNISNNDLSGLSIGYSRAIPLSESMPLFVEPGIALEGLGCDEETVSSDTQISKIETRMANLKVPVNLGYQFALSQNGNLTVAPYVGLTFRYTASFKIKDKTSNEEVDVFDVDEMDAKRFQVGFQVGAKFAYKHFIFSGYYGKGLSKFTQSEKLNVSAVMLGYCF